ncbi:unnamed protein product [Lampetra planeri]
MGAPRGEPRGHEGRHTELEVGGGVSGGELNVDPGTAHRHQQHARGRDHSSTWNGALCRSAKGAEFQTAGPPLRPRRTPL